MTLKLTTLTGLVIALLLAAPRLIAGGRETPKQPQSVIVVEASYPGATAQVVADTVAAPIEQQVNGIENLLHVATRSTSDGKCLVAATFKPGADLDKARALVQDRVALAQAVLPEEVKRGGITVRKKLPIEMMVSLVSPDGRFSSFYLTNYASIHVQDELARVAGVGEIAGLGQRDYGIRVWLNPDKMAAHKVTSRDVMKAIRQQNVQVAAGQIGKPPTDKEDFQLKLSGQGRLSDPKQFEDLIVHTNSKGAKIRLKDVGSVELGAVSTDNYVSLNGNPGVLLCIYPTGAAKPMELSRAVADRIAMLRARAPEGLQLEVAFDFTANLRAPAGPKTPEYLLLDLELPDAASMDRKRATLNHCEKLLRDVAGVEDVLALTENPFDMLQSQPCILVRLAPRDTRKITREEMIRSIRTSVEKIPDIVVRIRDLSRQGGFPRCGYPLELAVSGPKADKVRGLAEKLAEQLQMSNKLTDVWANRESRPRPTLYVDVDRAKAKDLGVEVHDIFDTLRVHLGTAYGNEFQRFGRTWLIVVQTDDQSRKRLEDLTKINIRDREGKLVPLARVAAVKTVNAPAAVLRLDSKPMVAITANPAPEVTHAQARKLCETQFDQLLKDARLAADYRLTWLQE